MTNLIENASKYGDNGTTVYIKSSYDNDFVTVSVTDTGVGISEKDYDKIFTKFSRIDNPLTRKVQGSGLGLYIAKSLVEKMKGEIGVKSKDNETTFSVKFPSSNIERQAQNAISYTDN